MNEMSANEPTNKPQEMTLEDAKQLIKDLEHQVKELNKQIDQASPEAVYSFNTNGLCKDGLCGTWTIRSRCGENAASFYARVDTVLQSLITHGWSTPIKPEKASPASTQAPTATSTPPVKDTPHPSESKPVTFKAQSLTATVNDGKTYWKVKGGQYGKWGVTVWGEVLDEAGFDSAKLDPMKTYDLTGFTAHVYFSEDNKPQKVWKLTK